MKWTTTDTAAFLSSFILVVIMVPLFNSKPPDPKPFKTWEPLEWQHTEEGIPYSKTCIEGKLFLVANATHSKRLPTAVIGTCENEGESK